MKISGSSMLDLLITNLSGMETIESNIHFRCPFVPPISLMRDIIKLSKHNNRNEITL